jgi:hypothetical protein
VQESCHAAQAAVALGQFEVFRRIDLEPDTATMTATLVNSHGWAPPALPQTTR